MDNTRAAAAKEVERFTDAFADRLAGFHGTDADLYDTVEADRFASVLGNYVKVWAYGDQGRHEDVALPMFGFVAAEMRKRAERGHYDEAYGKDGLQGVLATIIASSTQYEFKAAQRLFGEDVGAQRSVESLPSKWIDEWDERQDCGHRTSPEPIAYDNGGYPKNGKREKAIDDVAKERLGEAELADPYVASAERQGELCEGGGYWHYSGAYGTGRAPAWMEPTTTHPQMMRQADVDWDGWGSRDPERAVAALNSLVPGKADRAPGGQAKRGAIEFGLGLREKAPQFQSASAGSILEELDSILADEDGCDPREPSRSGGLPAAGAWFGNGPFDSKRGVVEDGTQRDQLAAAVVATPGLRRLQDIYRQRAALLGAGSKRKAVDGWTKAQLETWQLEYGDRENGGVSGHAERFVAKLRGLVSEVDRGYGEDCSAGGGAGQCEPYGGDREGAWVAGLQDSINPTRPRSSGRVQVLHSSGNGLREAAGHGDGGNYSSQPTTQPIPPTAAQLPSTAVQGEGRTVGGMRGALVEDRPGVAEAEAVRWVLNRGWEQSGYLLSDGAVAAIVRALYPDLAGEAAHQIEETNPSGGMSAVDDQLPAEWQLDSVAYIDELDLALAHLGIEKTGVISAEGFEYLNECPDNRCTGYTNRTGPTAVKNGLLFCFGHDSRSSDNPIPSHATGRDLLLRYGNGKARNPLSEEEVNRMIDRRSTVTRGIDRLIAQAKADQEARRFAHDMKSSGQLAILSPREDRTKVA